MLKRNKYICAIYNKHVIKVIYSWNQMNIESNHSNDVGLIYLKMNRLQ